MPDRTIPQRMADNIALQVLARLAMLATPLMIAALAWMGSQWLDGRFANVDSFGPRLTAAESAIIAIQQHNAVSDNAATNARSDRLDFQSSMAAKVDGIANDQRAEAIDIASIKATLDAIRGRLGSQVSTLP